MDQRLADALARVTTATAAVEGIDASILDFITNGIPAIVAAEVKIAVDAAMAIGATEEELAPFDAVGTGVVARAQVILDAINAKKPPATQGRRP